MRSLSFLGGNRWAVLVIALCVTGRALPAEAAEPNEDELIRQGVAKRRHQDDEAALELFAKAYAISHSPRSSGQMGLAEMALGRWLEAEAHLQESLAAAADPWVKKNTSTLQDALEKIRGHLGSLQVLGGPNGAEVVLEGEVRGTLPMEKPIRVRAGDCRFAVRAPGYEPLTRTVQISAENLTRETVHLAALPPVAKTPEPAPASTPERPAAAPSPALSLSQSPAEPDQSSGRTLRIVGLSLAGSGVAFVGAGVTFGLLARSQGKTDSQAMTFLPANQSKGKMYETLQYVGYGVGGALVAAGIVTYVLGYQRDHNEPAKGTAFLPSIVPLADGLVAGFAGSL